MIYDVSIIDMFWIYKHIHIFQKGIQTVITVKVKTNKEILKSKEVVYDKDLQ